MHETPFRRIGTAALASAVLAVGACSESLRGDATGMPAVSAPLPALSDSQAAALSSTGVGAVQHIVTARTRLAAGDAENARQGLERARNVLDGFLATRPAVRVKSRIWLVRERLGSEEGVAVIDDLGSVDPDLDRMEAGAGGSALRLRLAAALVALEAGDSPAAAAALAAADAALGIADRDVPAARAYVQVRLTLDLLARGERAQAMRLLASVEEKVQLMVAAVATRKEAKTIN